MKNGTAKKLALLCCSGILSFSLLELLLRRFDPPRVQESGTRSTPNAKAYGWALPPSRISKTINPDTGEAYFFKTNSQGWKDAEHERKKPEGKFRILFLGDSGTYGFVALNDLYTRKAQFLLEQRGYPNVEIITMGVSGWGPDQMLEAFLREGVHYAPDLVVYEYCGNDITDILYPSKDGAEGGLFRYKPFKYELVDGKLVKRTFQTPEDTAARKNDGLLAKSLVLRNLLWWKARFFSEDSPQQQKTDRTVSAPAQKNSQVRKYAINPKAAFYCCDPQKTSPELRAAYDLLEAIITKMQADATRANAGFVFYPIEWDEGAMEYNLRRESLFRDGDSYYVIWEGRRFPLDTKKPRLEFTQFCARQNIPILIPKRKYDRYQTDPHANAIGNQRMAEDVVDFLIDNRMIPESKKAAHLAVERP